MVVMNDWVTAVILGLGVSADALACGFSAGTSGLKVPFRSALIVAVISAFTVAFGFAAGGTTAPFLPDTVQKYISFSVLAVFGLCKLCGGENSQFADSDLSRQLSAKEAVALGSALSVDGLAAGFGAMATLFTAVIGTAVTFVFTAVALYMGAKSGRGVKRGRAGNIVAGLALVALAVQKLL